MQGLHPNIVFILFESFQVKAFYFKLQEANKKDSYVFQDIYKSSIPFLWKKDSLQREVIVKDLLSELIRFFELQMQDIYFVLVSDDGDFYDISYDYQTSVSVVAKKDLAIIPYFASSYISAGHAVFTHLKYYTIDIVDNQGVEEYTKWDDWRRLAIMLKEGVGEDKAMDMWLNNLIRPVITPESFFISSIAALMFKEGHVRIDAHPGEVPAVIAGGEIFSWLKNPRDVVFPYVVSMENPVSFMSVYHDMENILSLGKALKGVSLSLLERSTARFVVHIADILTVKAKKITKSMSITGKITIHDDDGYKTLYPVMDDIMVIPVKGLGKVTLDLHYPFYVDDAQTEYRVRDLFVIDTRIKERTNIMNYRGWYDRIKTV